MTSQNRKPAVSEFLSSAERKLVVEKLHIREEGLIDYLENGALGLHWVGPDGAILWANQAEMDLLGYSREEYIGRHIADFHADKNVAEDILARLAANETLRSYEARLKCKDGTVKHALIDSNVLWEDGKFVHTRCFTRDITDLKLIEAELRESRRIERERRKELEILLQAAPAGIWISHDPHCRRITVNPTAAALMRMPADGSMSKSAPEPSETRHVEIYRDGALVAPDDLPMQTAARTGHPVPNQELEFRFADGSSKWGYGTAVPLPDEHGQVRGVIAIFVDITDRKQAEEKLRKLNLELEQRVEKRTAEAQQATRALLKDMEEREKLEAQLLQAQKMESIGTLAGGIAHDFNNILNIIQGHVSLLDEADAGERAESIEVINKSIRRGAGVVQHLLTLARKSDLRLQSTDINQALDDAARLLQETLPKTIRVAREGSTDLPPIMADPTQITQALLNLCLNARDAMPQGGELTLRATVVDGESLGEPGDPKAERYVCVEITDTGLGMDKALQSRIFEPFFTTKGIDQGTGLGLSVVYGIVKNHKGFIQVHSQPGSGTTFQLWFPVAPEERSMELFPESALKAQTADSRRTILVVEDELLMLRLLEKRLLQHGYEVLTAADGEQAIELFRSRRQSVDAVLLDVGLPKISGWEVFQKMKEENPRVKVVVASGYLDPELKTRLIEAGAGHMIYKPYQLDEIVEILRSLTQSAS